MDLVEVLGFLFMLSTTELGKVSNQLLLPHCEHSYMCNQDYSVDNLSNTQKVTLEDLRDYGLLWQRKVCTSIRADALPSSEEFDRLHHVGSILLVLRLR
jgi:Transcription factor Tfb2